jgi:hypothetical protein
MVAITAVFVTQSVYGVPDHQMVFTENLSSSLTVTFDGSSAGFTVLNPSPDAWSVTGSQSLAEGTNFFAIWGEPSNDLSLNQVLLNGGSGNTFTVISDFPVATGVPNGFTYVGLFTDTSDGVAVDVTFNDNGDTARTPDTGTTGSLLGLSLVGLAFLRRKLC